MMGPLSIWIGLRFYLARQSNRFISFISFASTAGIALGVAVLIIVLSAMNGFEHELKHRLLGVISHGELIGANEAVKDWKNIVKEAEGIAGITGAAPFITLPALVQKPDGFQGLSLRGIAPNYEVNVSNIQQFMSDETWKSLQQSDQNNIVFGAGLAKRLSLEVGDRVSLYLPNIATTPNTKTQGKIGRAKSHQFTLSGIFSLGGELDMTTAYISMDYGAQILGYGDGVSGVRIKVDDLFAAPHLVKELGFTQNQYLYLNNWTRTQGHLYQDIQLVRLVMYLVLSLVIAVACFNIVSTLVMAVRDKQSEIAILLTMGMKRSAILIIFVVQGALNGLLGCILGGAAGIIIALNLSAIAQWVESILGVELLSSSVYFIDFLPSKLQWVDVTFVLVIALIMSLVATLYPAWKASQTLPARALA